MCFELLRVLFSAALFYGSKQFYLRMIAMCNLLNIFWFFVSINYCRKFTISKLIRIKKIRLNGLLFPILFYAFVQFFVIALWLPWLIIVNYWVFGKFFGVELWIELLGSLGRECARNYWRCVKEMWTIYQIDKIKY